MQRVKKRFKKCTTVPHTTRAHIQAKSGEKRLYEWRHGIVELNDKLYNFAVGRPVPSYIFQDGKTFGQFYKAWLAYLAQALESRGIHPTDLPLIYRFDFKDPDVSLLADTTKGHLDVKIGDLGELSEPEPDIVFNGPAFNAVAFWAREVELDEAMTNGPLSITGHKIDKFRAIHEVSDYLRGEIFLKWLSDQGYTREEDQSLRSRRRISHNECS